MKKAFVLIIFLISALSFGANPVNAACRSISSGQSCSTGQFERTYVLTDGGSAQCTSGVNGTYTICCDTQSEANAADSVRAPICGSSVELGKANSSCWTCGSDYRCAGLSFGLGDSDPFITGIRNPVNPGDTNTSEVWRIRHDQIQVGADGKFLYNGERYDPPAGDLIICNANVLGCGASDVQCTSTLYPGEEITDANPEGRVERILANPGSNPGDPIPGFIPLNFLGALGTWLTRQIAATIRYENDIHEGMTDFGRIGTMVENAAIKPLMPGALQPEYSPVDAGDKPGRYPLRGVSLYRLCIDGSGMAQPDGDPQDDNVPMRGATLTEGPLGFSSPNPRFWPQSISGSRLLTAYFLHDAAASGVNFVAPNGDPVEIESIDDNGRIFYDTPNMSQVDDAAYDCGSRTNGAPQRNVDTDAGGEARTGLPGTGSSGGFFAWLTEVTARIFPPPQLTSCGPDDPQETCANVPWEVVRSDYIPADLAVVSQFIGLTPDQLNPNMPVSDRVEIAKDGGSNERAPGGWTRTLLPQKIAANIAYPHANAPQGQNFLGGILGGVSGNFDAYPRWLKGVTDAFTCSVDNMIIPSALQTVACPWEQEEPWPGTSDRPLASWTPAQSLPPDFQTTFFQGSVKDAIKNAAKDKIPACVLEGVKFIESGPEWIGGNSCIINQCSAAGPFQITVGVDGNGDPNCRGCGPSWADGSRTCPDGWPDNWPTTPTDPSPCDLQLSANQAVQILIDKSAYFASKPLNATDSIQSQRDAIMLAADAYWGVTAPVARLGGCTYGEYVYKHCDPSYQCTGNPPYRLP